MTGLPRLALLVAGAAWFDKARRTVPEPYLDEVFHVRQAQHYCAGAYGVWDPNITTPPALYLLSAFSTAALRCDVLALRATNLVPLLAMSLLLDSISRVPPCRSTSSRPPALLDVAISHTAVNVCLLPPLFFFLPLYYTDVCSTFSVLLFWWRFVASYSNARPGVLSGVELVLWGLVSLAFRQTNVFWVALFPAGVVLLAALDRGHDVVKQSMYHGTPGFGDGWTSIAKTAWRHDVVYDPPVRDAWLEDYAKTVLTIAICALKAASQPKRQRELTAALAPFLLLIISFAAFVMWNGSVVLGDKSNHVATIHLPQMLYLWPYITFFSWPLLLPYLLAPVLSALAHTPLLGQIKPLVPFRRRSVLPRRRLIAAMTLTACAFVRFNTIVHPFTLADNRHYTFYVFRLLLRHRATKYLVTPIYVLCAWASIQALGAALPARAQRQTNSTASEQAPAAAKPAQLLLPAGRHSAHTSFVLLWLATAALQLSSAPLVEPRYFILPWIFWRMHLPLHPPPARPRAGTSANPAHASTWRRAKNAVWDGYDHSLTLETAWLVLVNGATGYVFVQWGFEWEQEPGRVQRFMW